MEGQVHTSVKRFKHTCLQQVQSVMSMKIAISLAFGQMATTNCIGRVTQALAQAFLVHQIYPPQKSNVNIMLQEIAFLGKEIIT